MYNRGREFIADIHAPRPRAIHSSKIHAVASLHDKEERDFGGRIIVNAGATLHTLFRLKSPSSNPVLRAFVFLGELIMTEDSTRNILAGTPLAHHNIGDDHCPHCDRLETIFPLRCNCGGLVHRQGDADNDDPDRYVEICDTCGARNAEYATIISI